jgi:hypothetical protein
MARLLLGLFTIIGGASVMGCGPTTATTGAFTEVNRLESNLKRGVSTKSDVQQVLGTPTGSGSAIFPTDPTAREVWFYQDIEVTDAKPEGSEVIRVNARQQILLVFFKREVFDGFMWYSNVVAGTGKSQ